MEQQLTLRQHRKLRGHTIRSLASAAGVGPHTVMRIEKGGSARAETFKKLAEALGVSPIEIKEFVDQAMKG